MIAALLTRMSILPKRSKQASTIREHAAGSVRSAVTTAIGAPSASVSDDTTAASAPCRHDTRAEGREPGRDRVRRCRSFHRSPVLRARRVDLIRSRNLAREWPEHRYSVSSLDVSACLYAKASPCRWRER